MKVNLGAFWGKYRPLILAALIGYVTLEVGTLGVFAAPVMPISYLVIDTLGWGLRGAIIVLTSLMGGMLAGVGLVVSAAPPAPPAPPVREEPVAPPAEEEEKVKGLDRSYLNKILDYSARNFVEVFPLRTGAINIYGAVSKEEGTEGYRYVVIEPELSEKEKKSFAQLKELLIEEMNVDLRSIETPQKAEAFLSSKVAQLAKKYGLGIPRPTMRKLQYYFARDFIHLGKVEPLMLDPLIEDVSCDGPKIPIYVWHRDYESIPTNLVFNEEEELDSFVSKLAYVSGKHISLAVPLVDASLQDGSRLHLTYGKEVTQRGSTFTIRKFKADPLTIVDLIKYNTINAEVAAYLGYLVEKRFALLVAGATASGKTTSLNCLSMFIVPGQKIVSVEDSVTGDSEILVSDSGGVHRVKIGPYVDSAISRESVRTEMGHEVARPGDVSVLTANRSGRVLWSPCTALIRHKVRKEFVKVSTRSGKSIEVTADHSLFTVGEHGEVTELSGRDIGVGTFVLAPRLIPIAGRKTTFDLEKMKEFSDYWFKNAPVANGGGGTVQQLRVHAVHSPLSIPAQVPLNADLAFLAGLWVADGFYGERSVGFSAGGKGVESRLRATAGSLGVNVTHHSDGISLLINSKPFMTLFAEVLGLKGDDYSRRVPDVFFDATDDVAASFLRGYFTGDASVDKNEIYAESASRELLLDLQTLLLRFGIVFKVGTKRKVGTLGGVGTYRGSITGSSQVMAFAEQIGFEQEGKMRGIVPGVYASKYYVDPVPLNGRLLEEMRGVKKEDLPPKLWDRVRKGVERGVVLRRTLLELGERNPGFRGTRAYALAASDLHFDEVVSIERSSREEYVYDLSVPETGMFIANNLVCHNTPELSLPHENWIQEVTRAEGTANEISLFDLVRNSLRQRPDIIIVGEIRGKEAFSLFQAISTGHGGFSTIHADSVEAVFNRLTTEPMSIPRSLVGTSLDCIVLQLKLRIGDRSVRRVVSVSEILGYDNRTNEMVMNEVYKWDPVTDRLVASGRSRLVDKINQRYGIKPEEVRRDLESRKVFLEWLASKNYRSYGEVSTHIQEFYANPYAMASRARTELEALQ